MRYVLVHGVAHGGWCWERVQSELEAAGHTVTAPDLPLTSLDDDATHVARLLEASDEPTVLAGHSYGGLVISQAAHADRVDHLVYVAALMVEPGIAPTDLFDEDPGGVVATMQVDSEHFSIPVEAALDVFYNTCDADDANRAADRLRPTALACVAAAPDRSPWVDIPSTYVLCEQDAAIPAATQARMAESAGRVVRLDCDHSPFYSDLSALMDVLLSPGAAT